MLTPNNSTKEPKQTENKTIFEKYCSSCDSVTKTIINYNVGSATCSICGRKTMPPTLQHKLKQSM